MNKFLRSWNIASQLYNISTEKQFQRNPQKCIDVFKNTYWIQKILISHYVKLKSKRLV